MPNFLQVLMSPSKDSWLRWQPPEPKDRSGERTWQLARVLAGILAMITVGCGLNAPELQSTFRNPANLHFTIDNIVNEVKCELAHGVVRAIARDDLLAEQNGTPPRLKWLESWSALATLTLSAEEMSALNPQITYKDVLSNSISAFTNGNVTTGRSFTLGLGVSVSADGTRTGKVNFFFVFKDFLAAMPRERYTDLTVPCSHQGPVLLESHLGLDDWVEQALWPAVSNANLIPVGYNQPTSLISQEVNFVIKVSGILNPIWSLLPISIGSSNSPLFQASRNQTYNLLITLGKTAAAEAGKEAPASPSMEVLLSHLASEIGLAVSTAFRSVSQ